MVKVMTAGKGKTPIGPVYFTRDYVRHGFFFKKRYSQGARGVILREHRLLGQVTHVDMRLPDGKYLLDVPIDYIKTLGKGDIRLPFILVTILTAVLLLLLVTLT